MAKHYGELLAELATCIGLEADGLLKTQELIIDGRTICFRLEGDAVSGAWGYFAQVGWDLTPTPALGIRLLQANTRENECLGYTASLQPDGKVVLLAGREFIDAVDGEGAARAMKRFIDVVAYWETLFDPEALPRFLAPASATSAVM